MEALARCFQDALRGSAKLDGELDTLPLQCVDRDSFYQTYVGSGAQDEKATNTHTQYSTNVQNV